MSHPRHRERPTDDLGAAADPKDLLDRVVLVALVGIVDPPRGTARDQAVPRRQRLQRILLASAVMAAGTLAARHRRVSRAWPQ